MLEASELSQIGLERGRTAREAVQIMGDLAVKYGFYSGAWDTYDAEATATSHGEGGETLSVADPDEAWIFHVIPDDTGTSAIWVAQRVPDGNVAVVANQFIVRNIIKDSPDFM
jgi:dipeptidase